MVNEIRPPEESDCVWGFSFFTVSLYKISFVKQYPEDFALGYYPLLPSPAESKVRELQGLLVALKLDPAAPPRTDVAAERAGPSFRSFRF